MNITCYGRSGFHTSHNMTPKQAVKAKMTVLKEFCVVNAKNESAIKAQLEQAIKDNPGRDYEVVLDQVANALIMESLSKN